ncbi:hypothetical protein CDD83_1024 [Cordyceps sp. RAO-2017]|nr:hypothetical protein CDD83_1024 [Cordyceps sp. RAO-2017]
MEFTSRSETSSTHAVGSQQRQRAGDHTLGFVMDVGGDHGEQTLRQHEEFRSSRLGVDRLRRREHAKGCLGEVIILCIRAWHRACWKQ